MDFYIYKPLYLYLLPFFILLGVLLPNAYIGAVLSNDDPIEFLLIENISGSIFCTMLFLSVIICMAGFFVAMCIYKKNTYNIPKGWWIFLLVSKILLGIMIIIDYFLLIILFGEGSHNGEIDPSTSIIITLILQIIFVGFINILDIICFIGISKSNSILRLVDPYEEL